MFLKIQTMPITDDDITRTESYWIIAEKINSHNRAQKIPKSRGFGTKDV